MSTRYRHLYKKTEELKSAEITQSIREIFGTAHILDVLPENSSEVEPDNSDDELSTRNAPEEVVTEDKRVDIFICPLCGKDFGVIGTFSEHNKREHNNRIGRLEMFSYDAGKTRPEAQHAKE